MKIRIASLFSKAYLQACSGKHLKGSDHVRPHLVGNGSGLVRPVDRLRLRLRLALTEIPMTLDYTLAAIVAAGLLFYLTYALVRPEKF